MPPARPSVFISYRREGGADIARLLQTFLQSHSCEVFLDVDDLDAGPFEDQLLKHIERHDCFLMICSAGALDRCVDEGDYVRREIAHAILHKRRIIPVTLQGFSWPREGELSSDIAEFAKHQSFDYHPSHWKESSRKLLSMLQLPASPTAGSAHFSGPAWARVCLNMISRLQASEAERRKSWRECDGPDDGLDDENFKIVDDPEHYIPWLRLPLEIDTNPRYEPAKQLVRRGHELDRSSTPFATRLREAKDLIRKIPVASDPHLDSALLSAHLLNLVAVIRLHAEKHEVPDETIEKAVSRAAACNAQANEPHSEPASELNELCFLALDCLEFEIHLVANPPPPSELADARLRGQLAYGADWRSRLEARVVRHQHAFYWGAASNFRAPRRAQEVMPALWDFRRTELHSRWLCIAAELLLDPTAPLESAVHRHPRQSDRRLAAVDADPDLTARGAWRVVDLVSPEQFAHDEESAQGALRELLEDSLDFFAQREERGNSRTDDPSRPPLERIVELCHRLAYTTFPLRRARGIAALFRASRESGKLQQQSTWLRRVCAICFHACRMAGEKKRDRWEPRRENQTAGIRCLLWIHLFLVAEDAEFYEEYPYARDAVLVAIASDPGFRFLQDAVSLYQDTFGSEATDGLAEDLRDMLSVSLESLKGTIPLEVYEATVRNTEFLIERLDENLPPPSEEDIPF